MSIVEKILIVPLAVFALFVAYVFFIYTPVDMYTEAECLRNGYPKHSTTVGLERYCISLDGAVTVTVDHQ